jgi:HEAT repeat protein
MSLGLAAAIGVVLTMGATARGAPVKLEYKYDPGQVRTYERTVRTEVQMKTEKGSMRRIVEVPVKHQTTVLETRAQPSGGRLVLLETPTGERLIVYEENGQDRLAAIPPEQRTRPLRPMLAFEWRDPLGNPEEQPKPLTDPNQALEWLHAEMRILPANAVSVGEKWTRNVDLGILKATITTTFTEQRNEGSTPCAILSSTAAVTFTGNMAGRLTVEEMAFRTAAALDGSGWVSHSGTTAVSEKADQVSSRVARTYQEKRVEASHLDTPQLTKLKADTVIVEKLLKQAGADQLEDALKTLAAFITDNAQSPWVPALEYLRVPLEERLKTERDSAAAQGAQAQLTQVEQAVRQISSVNAKGLLEQAGDPDTVVRDLMAFGLAFLNTDAAVAKLRAMNKDPSAQVRGTSAIGLAIQSKPADPGVLVQLLKDPDQRARGAGALLATRTLKRGDPLVPTLVPLLVENLKSSNTWTRLTSTGALAALAPTGSSSAAAALVAAYKAEKEKPMLNVYLQVLRTVTGVASDDIGKYEEWVKQHPPDLTPPPAAAPPAPTPVAPAPPVPAPAAPTSPAPKTPVPPPTKPIAPPSASPPTPMPLPAKPITPPSAPAPLPPPTTPGAMPMPNTPGVVPVPPEAKPVPVPPAPNAPTLPPAKEDEAKG